jgi:hypothetical protein
MKAKSPNGVEHEVEFGINGDQTFCQVFEAAHSREDGEFPHIRNFEDRALWSSAINLRRAEDELRRLCTEAT